MGRGLPAWYIVLVSLNNPPEHNRHKLIVLEMPARNNKGPLLASVRYLLQEGNSLAARTRS